MWPGPSFLWRNYSTGSLHTSPLFPSCGPSQGVPMQHMALCRQLWVNIFTSQWSLLHPYVTPCLMKIHPGYIFKCSIQMPLSSNLQNIWVLARTLPLQQRSLREGVYVSHFPSCLELTRPGYIRQDPNFPLFLSCFHPPSDSLFWNRHKQEWRLFYLNKLLGLLNLFLSLFSA